MEKIADHTITQGILFTDQYQISMAQLYYRMGLHQHKVQFDHFFRSYPNYGSHSAGYCINAGLEWFLGWMERARFGETEIQYLRSQKDRAGNQLLKDDFLHWLQTGFDFSGISLQAIPEGRVVHPYVPLTVVQGPMAAAQIMETALLNHLNFQTLIATKAARIHEISRGGVVMEFGLRRAQDLGGNAGARAALIGGADFSSNVGISHLLGFKPIGTHAHSMVQVFMALGEGELGAFRAYADVYPDDCLLLVDTIDTLESGVPNAIKVFEELRRKGHKPIGIRLDSGDLAYLTIQAGKMLNEAGFENTTIVWSNQLDELVIWQAITQIQQEAQRYGMDADSLIKRLMFGVGTKLITSAGDPALDGVYKLVAIEENGGWKPAIKVSESPAKTLNPGHKTAWRLYDQRGRATADLLSLDDETICGQAAVNLHHPSETGVSRTLDCKRISDVETLQVEILRDGKLVYELPSIQAIREQRVADIDRLDAGVKRLVNPHIYHVSLTDNLYNLKQQLIAKAR